MKQKIPYAKLATDFQAVLEEFHKVQRLASKRKTTYTPFVLHEVQPSSYTPFAQTS